MSVADVKQRLRGLARPVVRGLDRLGFSPLAVTLVGFVISTGAGVAAAGGRLRLAAVLLITGAGFDMLDGDLARLQGRVSRQGAFLDSNFDRLSEAALLLGLVWHFLADARPDRVAVMLTVTATVGSLTTSYARARAEGLGAACREGLFQRPERMVLLIAGLLLGTRPLFWALALLALLSVATTAQRIVQVSRRLAASDASRETES